jgi:hypothetical protein
VLQHITFGVRVLALTSACCSGILEPTTQHKCAITACALLILRTCTQRAIHPSYQGLLRAVAENHNPRLIYPWLVSLRAAAAAGEAAEQAAAARSIAGGVVNVCPRLHVCDFPGCTLTVSPQDEFAIGSTRKTLMLGAQTMATPSSRTKSL